jgi:murein DD-endopeptidase MepM/ murein hydrolase activator NlpD
MRATRFILYAALLLLLIPLTGLIWLARGQGDMVARVAGVPTRMVTAVVPSQTPADVLVAQVAQPAPAGVGGPDLPPTFTPVSVRAEKEAAPTPAATATLLPEGDLGQVADEESRSAVGSVLNPTRPAAGGKNEQGSQAAGPGCPAAPLKPEYGRYYLSAAVWPVPGSQVSSHFWMSKPFNGGDSTLINEGYPYGYDGSGRYLLHNGVDAAAPLGTPVLAVADGTVVVAQDDFNNLFGWRCDWYGHLVIVELDQAWLGQPVYALYGHVLQIDVEAGQHVARGEQLAEVGVGGAAEVAHLHFEVRVGANAFGATRNPMLWIEPASRGVISGRLLDPQGRPWHGVGLSLIGRSEGGSDGNTWSYMEDPLQIVNIHPDEGEAENFLFADVKPGEYDVYTRVQGNEYMVPVQVVAGQVSRVEIITQPFQMPTPSP